MATNYKVPFPKTPYTTYVKIEAKDTNYILKTAGDCGAKVEKIWIKFNRLAQSKTAILEIYVKDDGGSAVLMDGIEIAAVNGSVTVLSEYKEKIYTNFQLSPNQTLSVQITDINMGGNDFAVVFASIGDYNDGV